MSNSRVIIICTTKGDFHTDRFIELYGNQQIILLYPSDFKDLSVDIHDHKFFLNYKNKNFNMDNVSFWYRKPRYSAYDELICDDVTDEEIIQERYVRLASLEFYESLMHIKSNMFVLNEPIKSQSCKINQLSLAAEIGFNIPNTLISNNVGDLKNFITTNNNDCIIKSITGQVNFGRHYLYFQTNHITSDYLNDLDKDLQYPVFIQENIKKKNELRVTLIGNKIFACEMDLTNVHHVDTRSVNMEDIPHKIVELPDAMNNMLFEYAKALKINYGAFDILRDLDDNYYFLEVNPNGQYAWIESQTGAELTKAIGDLLLYPDKYRIV